MTETNMTIYDELVARGLIAQVTNEEEIKELYADAQKDYKAKRKENVLDKAYDEADKSIKRHWKRLEESKKNKQ